MLKKIKAPVKPKMDVASDKPLKEASPLEALRDKMEMSKKPKVKIMGKF